MVPVREFPVSRSYSPEELLDQSASAPRCPSSTTDYMLVILDGEYKLRQEQVVAFDHKLQAVRCVLASFEGVARADRKRLSALLQRIVDSGTDEGTGPILGRGTDAPTSGEGYWDAFFNSSHEAVERLLTSMMTTADDESYWSYGRKKDLDEDDRSEWESLTSTGDEIEAFLELMTDVLNTDRLHDDPFVSGFLDIAGYISD